MPKNSFSYDEMDQAISIYLAECKKIRDDRQKDYGFHFYGNYNKYGLIGFLVNDNEITARLEQIESKIQSNENYNYSDAEDRLRNALYDGINYRLLFLFWLNREKWSRRHNISTLSTPVSTAPVGWEVHEFNSTGSE